MNLIVNVNKSWGIGKDGDLLCKIPQDSKWFKNVTIGHTVIYGRKTLESLPLCRPLEGRKNIVITKEAHRYIKPATENYVWTYGGFSHINYSSSSDKKSNIYMMSIADKLRDTNIDEDDYAKAKTNTSLFTVSSISDAIVLAGMLELNTRDVFICGGESIYKQMAPYCEYAYVTINDCELEADTFFPNLEEDKNWETESEGSGQIYTKDDGSRIIFSMNLYKNKNVERIIT